MTSWTNATPQATPAGVILRQRTLDAHVDRWLAPPSAPLAGLVERYWALRWAQPATRGSSLVPQFAVNLTWEVGSGRPGTEGSAVLTGPCTGRFDVTLVGHGRVVGVKFVLGAVAALTGTPASALTDRTVPAADVLPRAVVDSFVAAASDHEEDAPARLAALEDAVAGLLPVPDEPGWRSARAAVELARRPDVVRVEQLAEATGQTVRGLQRLFDRWVGVPPKQVITRLRLQDAVAALESDEPEALGDLAHRLGFFDQAHLTREFTRFVGTPPARYLREQPTP